MNEYEGRQFVGIDLHRHRSVMVHSPNLVSSSRRSDRQRPGRVAATAEDAGADPEVVMEATYGWYWAVDVLQAPERRCIWHPRWVSKGFDTGE